MPLTIAITKQPANASVSEPSQTFNEQGGSIGRGAQNLWVLPDPDCYLSTCHCKIVYQNGEYLLLDSSTNGTYLNGAEERIPQGDSVTLKMGDQFSIGDYEFNVTSISTSTSRSGGAGPFGDIEDVKSEEIKPDIQLEAPVDLNKIFKSDVGSEQDMGLGKQEGDIMDILDNIGRGENQRAYTASKVAIPEGWNNTHFSQVQRAPQREMPNPIPPEQGQQVESQAGNVLPNDWNNTTFSSAKEPDVPVQREIEPKPVQPSPPVKPTDDVVPDDWNNTHFSSAQKPQSAVKENEAPPKQAPPPPKPAPPPVKPKAKPAVKKAIRATNKSLTGMLGLDQFDLSNEDIDEINAIVGEAMRESIIGLMQVLHARNSIKNEFRMKVTSIQPVENNPLKFSANIDHALENMFVKKGQSYTGPVEAVKDGFQSIAEHQIALLEGVRYAFKSVIKRFDPARLEKRFAGKNKGGFLPGAQKAKNWDAYLEYYGDLVGDLDRSFQSLFGEDFVKAYEAQLQKFDLVKKKNKQK